MKMKSLFYDLIYLFITNKGSGISEPILIFQISSSNPNIPIMSVWFAYWRWVPGGEEPSIIKKYTASADRFFLQITSRQVHFYMEPSGLKTNLLSFYKTKLTR